MILVLGCGSIGRRHIANLQRLGRKVRAFDPDPSRRAWIEKNLGCDPVVRWEAALALNPDAVWVCTPPSLHAQGAVPFLERGISCFIEKPLAHSSSDAAKIARAAARGGARAAVGYQLRQHPGLRAFKREIESKALGRLLFLRAEIGQYLPDWRPWQDYRASYTARRTMGGGILLDASHEIDLIRWLGGEIKSVFCAADKLSALKINVEDTAALVCRLNDGNLAEIHLDMIQRAPRRNLQAVFEKGTLLWDLPTAELRRYTRTTGLWTTRRFPLEFNALYLSQARDFLAGRKTVSIEDGLRTLDAALAALKSARTKRMEKVP